MDTTEIRQSEPLLPALRYEKQRLDASKPDRSPSSKTTASKQQTQTHTPAS